MDQNQHHDNKSSNQKNKIFKLVSPGDGKSYFLSKKRVLIGSADACDIVLKDGKLNAIHAVIEIGTNGFKLFDMNSRHGSFVNDQKVIVQDCKVGDLLRFGSKSLTLSEASSSSNEKSVGINSMLESIPPLQPISQTVTSQGQVSTPRTPPLSPSTSGQSSVSTEDIPTIVYPLAKDPNAQFSEYIFEDADSLYPIFKYEHNSVAVEVIILYKEEIFSIDYLPANKANYSLAGVPKETTHVEYPYLGKDELVDFVEVTQGSGITVQPLHGYESWSLTEKADGGLEKADSVAPIALNHGEILRFVKDDIEIFVRSTEAPPKVKSAPFLRRESGLKRYLLLMLLFVGAFLTSMNLYQVDEEIKKEKVPERIATILYKKKRFISKEKPLPSIEKSKKKAPKKNIVKAKPKPKKEQKVMAKVDPKTTQKKKMTGDPKKTVKQKVKKAAPNKGKVDKIVNKVAPPKKTKSTPQKSTKAGSSKPRKAPQNRRSQGKVDVYKAANFKSTVSSLMAKGGSIKGAKASQNTGSNVGLSGVSSNSLSDGATLKKAKVSNNVGSLTGAASGKLDTSRGTEGLTNKRSIYTAGLPYKTVVLGGMDPDVIRRILEENIPQFRYCYQKELDVASSKFSGIVKLDFIIGASGHVTRAGVASADKALPSSVKSCVVNVLKGIKFPSPRGGGVVEVNQPFNFYPKQ